MRQRFGSLFLFHLRRYAAEGALYEMHNGTIKISLNCYETRSVYVQYKKLLINTSIMFVREV